MRTNVGNVVRDDMTSQETLITIYDAAISGDNWGRALDAIAQVMGANASLIYQVPISEAVEYRLEAASSYFSKFPDFLKDYNKLVTSGGGSNFDHDGMTFVHSRPAFQIHLDSEIFQLDQKYFQRPEVKFVSDKLGLMRRCAISLSDDPVNLTGMLFLYDDDFSDAASLKGAHQAFSPHIAKALEIHQFTHGLRTKYSAVLSVLDRISTGVLIVSGSGDIIVENSSASELLDQQDGLARVAGRLSAGDNETSAELKQSLADVSSTARGENNKSGTVVQIPRRSTGVPLVAVVSPLRDAEMEIERGLVGALVTIIDPLRPVDVQSDLIATAYGLTKAEARVAGLVLRGLSNVEISDLIGVSPETIKTQISSVLAKSGCKSRVALIWRVFQLAPPID